VRRQELEKILRSYEPLKGVAVHYPDAFKHSMMPTLVVIQGIVSIKGEHHAYELEVDLRSFEDRSDVEMLIKALLHSFEKAERGETV
jgi:3-deoxy-D-manno-octulosonic acid (KDO) 8-phosphate synthase